MKLHPWLKSYCHLMVAREEETVFFRDVAILSIFRTHLDKVLHSKPVNDDSGKGAMLGEHRRLSQFDFQPMGKESRNFL